MNFEENLKNFRFTDDSRDVFDACLGFAAFLEKNAKNAKLTKTG